MQGSVLLRTVHFFTDPAKSALGLKWESIFKIGGRPPPQPSFPQEPRLIVIVSIIFLLPFYRFILLFLFTDLSIARKEHVNRYAKRIYYSRINSNCASI